MKETALVLNGLLMWVFGLGSLALQIHLRNALMSPSAGFSTCFPPITALAIRILWVWWVLPTIWSVLTVLVCVVERRKPERMTDVVQLHTSATLLVGVCMLGFFIAAVILPFIGMVVTLSR